MSDSRAPRSSMGAHLYLQSADADPRIISFGDCGQPRFALKLAELNVYVDPTVEGADLADAVAKAAVEWADSVAGAVQP
jgi:hypothetical protein